MKQYIKMNKNDNNLSLGNFCLLIKDLSVNKNAAIQSQIVCEIFDIDSVNESTINNYCVGIRRIKDEYKEIYIRLKSKYQKDTFVMVPILNNLRSILNGKRDFSDIANKDIIKNINSDIKIVELSNKLYNIAKNDISVPNDTKDILGSFISSKNYYDFLSNALFFIVLDKKQPVYENEEKSKIIDKLIENTNISSNDLTKYINLKFTEEINYHHKLKMLAKENNPYANMELGINEYKGSIADKKRYDLAYNYFKAAALFNHPNAIYMKARIAIEIFKIDEKDDLEKAAKLGSVAALNFLGLCYKTPLHGFDRNLDLAIKYFTMAANKNYAYAYNNLGLIEEENNNYDKAISFYEISASFFESYACNKMGLHHMKENNFKLAFDFFESRNKYWNFKLLLLQLL